MTIKEEILEKLVKKDPATFGRETDIEIIDFTLKVTLKKVREIIDEKVRVFKVQLTYEANRTNIDYFRLNYCIFVLEGLLEQLSKLEKLENEEK